MKDAYDRLMKSKNRIKQAASWERIDPKSQEILARKNLNLSFIREDTGEAGLYGKFVDFSAISDDQRICVYFKDLESNLIEYKRSGNS